MKAFRTAAAPLAPRACAWRITRPARAGARWPALRLQWRRNARPQAPFAAVGHLPAPVLSWLTSIHLHFGSLREPPPMFAARARALPAAVPSAQLILADTPAGVARHSADSPLNAPSLSTRVMAAPSALLRRARRAAALPELRPAGGAAHVVPGAARRANRAATAQPSTSPQLAWKTSPAPHRRAPLQTAAGTSMREKSAAMASVAVPWQSGTPALVWRKPGVARPAAIGEPPLAAPPMMFAGPTQRQHAAPAPAAPTAAAMIAPVRLQLQSTAPDPAFADRLADEVIRRVERSMRIERERRGH